MSDLNVWFFGCWNEAGHYWARPNHAPHDYKTEPQISWIDGGYAPRRWMTGRFDNRHLVKNPAVCWACEVLGDEDRRLIMNNSEERAQCYYLVHYPVFAADRHGRAASWTVMSWWDRCQGDTRGACNSNLVVEGEHTAVEMRALLDEHYPHVVANIRKHGHELVWVPT